MIYIILVFPAVQLKRPKGFFPVRKIFFGKGFNEYILNRSYYGYNVKTIYQQYYRGEFIIYSQLYRFCKIIYLNGQGRVLISLFYIKYKIYNIIYIKIIESEVWEEQIRYYSLLVAILNSLLYKIYNTLIYGGVDINEYNLYIIS